MMEKVDYQKKALVLNLRGLVLMIVAGILFGTSGNIAKILFQSYNITPQWYAAFRALVAGIVLYIFLRPPFPHKNILRFFLYTVVGFAGLQISFFLTIAYANAPIATLLETLCIPLIVLYETVMDKNRPSIIKVIVIFLAVIGTILLSFGDTSGFRLIISPLGLLFGFLTAIASAIFPLMGVPLVRKYGSWNMITWCLLIGGITMSLWAPPWYVHPTGDISVVILLMLLIIAFGTITAFGLYMTSLKYVSASEANIVGLSEPLSSALVGLILLHELLMPLQYFGGVLMLAAIVILQVFEKNPQE